MSEAKYGGVAGSEMKAGIGGFGKPETPNGAAKSCSCVETHSGAAMGSSREGSRENIGAYSGRYPFTNSGDIRSVRW